MDVRYFLNRRIGFIRQFYATASKPYVERKRKIDAKEEPFVPPYTESGEPPFLEEWIEADESLHILAYSCIAMLAGAFHLYFESWVRQSGVAVPELEKLAFRKHGWLLGYKNHFAKYFGIIFDDSPANMRLLEEIVLARNRIEHPLSITSHRTEYSNSDLTKLRHPFFIEEKESAILGDLDEESTSWIMPPTLHITEAQLVAAASEVERFAEWFEPTIEAKIYAR